MKKINEIVSAGEFGFWEVLFSQNMLFILLELGFIVASVYIYIRNHKKDAEDGFFLGFYHRGFAMIPIGVMMMIGAIFMGVTYLDMVKQWEKEYVLPYLSNIEKQVSQTQVTQDDNEFTLNFANEKKELFTEVLFESEFKKRITEGIQTPQVEFYELKHSLGHGWEPGVYYLTLQLPEGYQVAQEDVSETEEFDD